MAARSQPLLVGITTAGSNFDGICYEQRDYASKILEGTISDDSYFSVIYTLDKADDPWDEANWVKANPALDICKKRDDMQRLAKKAQEQTSARNTFLTKHLNMWVQSAEAWLDLQRWQACTTSPPTEKYPVWVGVDLSNKIDFSAVVKLWRTHEGYTVDARFWLPENRLDTVSKTYSQLYKQWADDGYLTLTPGEVVDHSVIQDELIAWLQGELLQEIGYDPWSATQFALALHDEGLPMVEVPQTVKNLSEAMKSVEVGVLCQTLCHTDNPVLTWMMGNVLTKVDHNGNLFPRKESAEKKIDGAVALLLPCRARLSTAASTPLTSQTSQKTT